jgi:hypothetical protein
MHHPGITSGLSWSVEDQSVPATYTDYHGAPTWSRRLVQGSVSFHQSEGLVLGSTASFSCLEGDPGITSRVRTSQFQQPLQATGSGSGDPLPNGSDLVGASKMLQKCD